MTSENLLFSLTYPTPLHRRDLLWLTRRGVCASPKQSSCIINITNWVTCIICQGLGNDALTIWKSEPRKSVERLAYARLLQWNRTFVPSFPRARYSTTLTSSDELHSNLQLNKIHFWHCPLIDSNPNQEMSQRDLALHTASNSPVRHRSTVTIYRFSMAPAYACYALTRSLEGQHGVLYRTATCFASL